MPGPCASHVVVATVVTIDGRRFTGDNSVAFPQARCPRKVAGYPTGRGWFMCDEVCGQYGHAEMMALDAAGLDAEGADLYLEGRGYCCKGCRAACDAAGIRRIIFGPPPA